MRGNSPLSTKALIEIKKKKRVLLEDEESDWLQNRMAASLLDVKENKAIKKNFVFLDNQLVFPNTVTFIQNLSIDSWPYQCNLLENHFEVCCESWK